MKYVLNKCLVENNEGEIVWHNQKPDGGFLKFQVMLDSSDIHDSDFYKSYKIDHEDQFKIVVYLKDESKKKLVQHKVFESTKDSFDFFDCGFEVVDNSQHKGEVI